MPECWCITLNLTEPWQGRKWAQISGNPSLPLVDSVPVYCPSPFTVADTGHLTTWLSWTELGALDSIFQQNHKLTTPEQVWSGRQKTKAASLTQAFSHISRINKPPAVINTKKRGTLKKSFLFIHFLLIYNCKGGLTWDPDRRKLYLFHPIIAVAHPGSVVA